MSVLDGVFVAAVITAFVTAPFLFMRWTSGKVVFGFAVVVGLITAASSKSIARIEVLHRLQSHPSEPVVWVNGQQAQNPEDILSTLVSLAPIQPHHSSPSHRIEVQISGNPHLVLVLARDSSNPQEYWVFYPRHLITRSNEIGRIVTPLFDAY